MSWPLGTKLVIDIRGAEPVPKGSMKGFVVKGPKGPRAIVTDSKSGELKAFARDVREIAERAMKVRGLVRTEKQPLEMLAVFYLPRPGGHFDTHGGVRGSAPATPWTKPDFDKLTRAACDALTGIAFDDDARIVRAVIEKRFATKERDIGLWLQLSTLPSTMRELIESRQQTLPGSAHVG